MGCRILTSPRLGPTHCRRRAPSPIGHVQRPIAQRAGLLREKGACAASGTLVRRRGWGLPTVGGEPSRRSGMSRALSPRGLGSYERRGVCGIWHAGSSPRLGPTHCRRRAPSPIGHVQRPNAQRAGLLREKGACAASGTPVRRRGWGLPTVGGEPSRRSGMSSAPSPRGLGSYERKRLWRRVNNMGVLYLASPSEKYICARPRRCLTHWLLFRRLDVHVSRGRTARNCVGFQSWGCWPGFERSVEQAPFANAFVQGSHGRSLLGISPGRATNRVTPARTVHDRDDLA